MESRQKGGYQGTVLRSEKRRGHSTEEGVCLFGDDGHEARSQKAEAALQEGKERGKNLKGEGDCGKENHQVARGSKSERQQFRAIAWRKVYRYRIAAADVARG